MADKQLSKHGVRAQLRALRGLNNLRLVDVVGTTGTDPAHLSRFLREEADMAVSRLEKMLGDLGYELTITEKKEN